MHPGKRQGRVAEGPVEMLLPPGAMLHVRLSRQRAIMVLIHRNGVEVWLMTETEFPRDRPVNGSHGGPVERCGSGCNSLQMRRNCGSGAVLDDAPIGASLHADIAVAPGLCRQPLDHIVQ